MKRISIKIKFSSLIGFLILLVILTISFISSNLIKGILADQINQRCQDYAKSLADSATEGITTDDEIIIYEAIKNQIQKKGVTNAFILNKDGEVIAHNDNKQIGKEYDIIEWNSNYNEDVTQIKPRLFTDEEGYQMYDFLYPIHAKTFKKGRVKNILLGTAHIVYSYQIIIDTVNSAIKSIILYSVGILIIGIIGAFFLALFIVKPLMKIIKGAEEIGKGNLQYKIHVNTKDELELLSDQFNIMTDKLEEAQKSMLDQERLQYELDIATSIQKSLMPKEIPQVKDLTIASYYQSAKEVGGDYYDFYKIDDNRLGFIVADVSGKGVPGAMVMVMVRSILKTQIHINPTPFHTLLETNNLLTGDIRSGMFITAFYGIIDVSKSMLQFVNAGHNQLLILRQKTGKVEEFTEHGIPLGIGSPQKFEESLKGKYIPVKKGDIILQYTDGITEAKNTKNDEYELERLTNVIERNNDKKPDDLVKAIIDDVNFFCGEEPQYDDIAIIAIQI